MRGRLRPVHDGAHPPRPRGHGCLEGLLLRHAPRAEAVVLQRAQHSLVTAPELADSGIVRAAGRRAARRDSTSCARGNRRRWGCRSGRAATAGPSRRTCWLGRRFQRSGAPSFRGSAAARHCHQYSTPQVNGGRWVPIHSTCKAPPLGDTARRDNTVIFKILDRLMVETKV